MLIITLFTCFYLCMRERLTTDSFRNIVAVNKRFSSQKIQIILINLIAVWSFTILLPRIKYIHSLSVHTFSLSQKLKNHKHIYEQQ